MPENTSPSPVEQVQVIPPRRRPSLVWIIPLLAVVLSLGLGIKALLERGPEITLQFARAEGLEANKTRLKYKDVDIGTVTEITLSEDRGSVQVRVQVNNSARGLLVEDSRFWVVRPGLPWVVSPVWLRCFPACISPLTQASLPTLPGSSLAWKSRQP